MKWHLASLWETVADAVPDATALVQGTVRRSWRDYDDRSARIASAFHACGLGTESKIAIYAYNSIGYLEAQFGALKIRAIPISVNYRYTERELIYLLENSDAEALVFDAQFGPRVAAIRNQLPKVRCLVEIDDGSGRHLEGALPLAELIATNTPLARRDYVEDDIYMLYTGGTTGMPKGVMYRHADFTKAMMGGYDMRGMPQPKTGAELVATVRALHENRAAPVGIPASPIMHTTGMGGGVFLVHSLGGCSVLFRNEHFDADVLWTLVEREHVTDIALVGDAFAKPMLAALSAANDRGRPYDVSSLKRIFSSGAMLSREVKQGLLQFADITISDTMSSTEGSMAASVASRSGPPGETARFVVGATTKVFDANDREIERGSTQVGMIATSGLMPMGYYKDPAKTAATFREIDGKRYSFPGDFGQIAADGTLILLGRGSVCINTGGEKVFPEEVEEVLKVHPDILDCLVIGVPDERFGSRVVAVLASRDGRSVDRDSVMNFARTRIAGYKVPRQLVIVDEVRRAPNGKADYEWAKLAALQAAAPANATPSKS
jgi:fatty-acyl-CoA synthase